MKKKKEKNSYFTYIDADGNERPCNIYMKIKKRFVLTADAKLTLLLTLWVLDKIVMAVLLYTIK